MVNHSPDEFDLLLTDVIMPGMRGTEVAATLKRLHPRMKVLLMTGYADEETSAQFGNNRVIQKPFTPAALLASIKEVMEA